MGFFTHALLVFAAQQFRVIVESPVSVQKVFKMTIFPIEKIALLGSFTIEYVSVIAVSYSVTDAVHFSV